MQTQADYFKAHQVDGALTDEQMTAMLSLPVGDTPIESLIGDGGTTAKPASTTATTPTDTEPADPDADSTATTTTTPSTEPAPKTTATDPNPEPVILAKDGKHTIPYSELETARAAAASLQEQLAAAQAKLAGLTAPPAGTGEPADTGKTKTGAEGAPAADDLEFDLGDFSEDAIRAGLKTGVSKVVSAATAALQAEIAALQAKLAQVQTPGDTTANAKTPEDLHFDAIYGAHPDVESVVQSREFAAWRDAQPPVMRAGINAVIESGSAQDVITVLNDYKAATNKSATPTGEDPAGAAKQAAAAAIARAANHVPSSLSEVPGNAGQHEPGSALLDLSPVALMNQLQSKTPEQIMAALDKLI